jgi:hypothetical protein
MTQPPCKDCTDRVVGCHSGCGKYLAYHHYREELLEKKQEDNDIGDYCKKAILKSKFGHPESVKSKVKRRNSTK